MDSRTFLGLVPTHNPFRWKLPVTEGISTMGNFLFGGSGLGAAISALEGTSGRQCVWEAGPPGPDPKDQSGPPGPDPEGPVRSSGTRPQRTAAARVRWVARFSR